VWLELYKKMDKTIELLKALPKLSVAESTRQLVQQQSTNRMELSGQSKRVRESSNATPTTKKVKYIK
tara:strand:+ start:2122 stop:2322 length:201 start_codon:yes stop_codon:yes gene_type:complete